MCSAGMKSPLSGSAVHILVWEINWSHIAFMYYSVFSVPSASTAVIEANTYQQVCAYVSVCVHESVCVSNAHSGIIHN